MCRSMAKNEAGEPYETFKARKWKELDTRVAGRTYFTQQKLLRVHLQHFLLTVGAELTQGRNGLCQEELVSEEHDMRRSFAREQKRLAIAREASRAERHRAAKIIQNVVRRQRLRKDKAIESEEELPSTSVLIPLVPEVRSKPLETLMEVFPAKVDSLPVDPPPRLVLPPYEVVAEVVAARDLALSSSLNSERYLETELLLKRQSAVIARIPPARQIVSSFEEYGVEIPIQNCSLRFSFDLNISSRHGLATPQSVIDELSATATVKDTSGGNTNVLGVVDIPLVLLETPFAANYALCRWFPLEKAHPGHTARGHLRVSVCYLMRQTSSDSVVMVPYVNMESKSNEIKVEQQKRPAPRRVKKTPGPAVAKRKPAIKSTEQEQAGGKLEKLRPARLSLRSALSSPTGRISRAEALSPPSSPSSVASSESNDNVESSKPDSPGIPSRRFFPPKKQQKDKMSVRNAPDEDKPVQKENSSRTPPKNFLKRKPYKVVFQKLDWSGVASKTDSNLPTNGSNRTNSGVGSQPSKPSRSSSRATTATSNSEGTVTSTESIIAPKPGAFIDAATAQRLAALETAMFERCGVTRETASLARFKYQKERKTFVATLQSQAQTRQRDANQPPSQESSEVEIRAATSEAAVTELWKKLTSDSSGQIYASMLRSLTEKPVKAIESIESGIAS